MIAGKLVITILIPDDGRVNATVLSEVAERATETFEELKPILTKVLDGSFLDYNVGFTIKQEC